MKNIDENRIRKLAYQIWESEGCPHGEDERHWQMAQTLAQAETGTSGQAGASDTESSAPRSAPRTKRVASKPASVTRSGKSRPRNE